jgi:hypothetical protein
MLSRPHRTPTPCRVPIGRPNRRVIATVVALCALSLPGLTRAADTPTGGTIGTFTFSGELHGALKTAKIWNLGYTLTQAGCEKTVAKTSFNVFFYNVNLALNGASAVLTGGFQGAAVLLNVVVEKYGNTESFANRAAPGSPPDFMASVGFSAYHGHAQYTWETNAGSATVLSSGTITTNATGTGGSLTATLVPAGTGLPSGLSSHATAPLKLRGSWTSCVPFK